jgi:hypothetical protein
VDGILGGLMVIYCVVGILARLRRERRDDDSSAPHRSSGSHAA